MKKKEKILICILVVLLVVVGGIYVNVKFTDKGKNIKKQEISKGQLSQTTGDNAYVSTQTHLAELNEIAQIQSGTITSNYDISDDSYARKNGNRVDMYLRVNNIPEVKYSMIIANLPEGFRTGREKYRITCAIRNQGSGLVTHSTVCLATNGNISIDYVPEGEFQEVVVCCSFYTDI